MRVEIAGGLFLLYRSSKFGTEVPIRIKLKTANPNPLFPKLLLKHVARMQRSGIREWRDFKLPGQRCAPSGLRYLDSQEAVDSDLAARI